MRRSFRRKLLNAERHLAATCPKLAVQVANCGKCKLEVAWERSLYEALVRAIAHQQLHGKAAQSILQRFIDIFPKSNFPAPRDVLTTPTEQLRGCGFSQAKVVAIQGIAEAAATDMIPTRSEAEQMSDEEIIARLITLRGVGRWTVEMLLIFTLGRLDVMPVDDYGVRIGLQKLYQLKTLPKKLAFSERTDVWQPYRSVGAWYLWRLADELKLENAKQNPKSKSSKGK